MTKWKATMPREEPDEGKRHVVIAFRSKRRGRTEYSGQLPQLETRCLLNRAMTLFSSSQRRVVCAANRHGRVLVLSARHFDQQMHAQYDRLLWDATMRHGAEQGFIDTHGVFMTRTEAWPVALAAGQIIHRCGGDDTDGGTLYSENLY